MQNMKPAYEKVAKAFAPESDCVVAQMDADDADNKPIAARYEVRSFPTIKFFPKGSKEPIAYSSGRTEDQFVEVSGTMYCLDSELMRTVLERAMRYTPDLDRLAFGDGWKSPHPRHARAKLLLCWSARTSCRSRER